MRKLPYAPTLKRLAEEELGENVSELTRSHVKMSKPYVSKTFTPIKKGELDSGRMDLVYLKGTPYLACCRSTKNPKITKEFYLSSDFGGFLREMCTCRFSSYEDFVEYAKSDANAYLLLQCTNLSAFHFKIAAENYGVKIPIGWDFEKYFKKVGKPTALIFDDYEERIKRREARSIYLMGIGKRALKSSIKRNTK